MAKKQDDVFGGLISFGNQKPMTLEQQKQQTQTNTFQPRQPIQQQQKMSTTVNGIPTGTPQKPQPNPNAFADLLGGTGFATKTPTTLSGQPIGMTSKSSPMSSPGNTMGNSTPIFKSTTSTQPGSHSSPTKTPPMHSTNMNALSMLDPFSSGSKSAQSFQFTPAVANLKPMPVSSTSMPMTATKPVEDIKWDDLGVFENHRQPLGSTQPTSAIDPFDVGYLGMKSNHNPIHSSVDDNPLGILSLSPSAVQELKKGEELKSSHVSSTDIQNEPRYSESDESEKLHRQVLEIVNMGFSEEAATNALLNNELDMDKAVNSLIAPPVQTSSRRASEMALEDDPDLQVLLNMGFKANLCRQALRASNGDVDAAIELLVRQKQSRRVSFHDDTPQASVIDASKIVETASSFGMSMLKNAKNALQFSKKKVGEVLEKAAAVDASKSKPEESEADWSKPKFKDEYPIKEKPLAQVTAKPYNANSKPVPANTLIGDEDEVDVPLQRRSSPIRQESLINVDVSIPKPAAITSTSKPTALSPTPLQTTSKPPQMKPIVSATPQQIAESEKLKAEGNEFFKQGQYAAAEEKYTKAIDNLPKNHELQLTIYNNRAACRLKNGDSRGAVSDCNMILDVQQDVKALLRRANAYEMQEKWEAARDDYRVIMGIDPNVKGVSLGLSRCTNALAPKPQVLASTEMPLTSKPMQASVKKAVDEAVQKLREQNLQSEQEETEKFALLDTVNLRVELADID
jgi:hypothetical protein